jgi:hypothetical protein
MGRTTAWVAALQDPKMDEDDPLVSNASLETPTDEGITDDQLLVMMESERVDLDTRMRWLDAEIAALKASQEQRFLAINQPTKPPKKGRILLKPTAKIFKPSPRDEGGQYLRL